MVRLLLIGAAALGMFTLAAQSQPSEELKRTLVTGIKRECMVTQRSAPENRQLSNETLTQYCNCVGDGYFASVTIEELREIATGTSIPAGTQKKMTALGNACIQRMLR